MRKIKFRGKRTDNRKWKYGFYYYNQKDDVHVIVENTTLDDTEFDVKNKNILRHHVVDPKTVGQFVGVQDKQGTDIYEDDIIEYGDYSRNVRVRLGSTPQPKIRSKIKINDLVNSNKPKGNGCFKPEHLLILGNIHDQPELLEI
mgnify:CR=1 FL=1